MNDTLQPSRTLRMLSAAASGLWWVLVAFWLVLLLAWAGLHGWIVPRIGELRPALETQATRALGIPVRIGSVSARSDGLVPSFELRDVVLLDAQSREALRLTRVVVALSPRSLWNLGFDQLFIEGPALDVRRLPDGRLSVAGLDMSGPSTGDERAADWFFRQKEVLVLGGSVRWTDEMRAAPPLTLTDVQLVVRNGPLRHALRLDATPPPEWGARFSLRGIFRQPLLSQHPGRWQTWNGQMFADFSSVDLSHLRQYANLGVDVRSGSGQLRAWADVERGQVTGGAADVRLAQVDALLAPGRQPLLMTSVSGHLAGRWLAQGFSFETRDLQFQAADGRRWPGGNVSLSWDAAQGRQPERGQLRADRLDLEALGRLASHLPLSAQAQALLDAQAPTGQVDQLQASWEGAIDQLRKYQAKGRVSQLSLPAHAASGRPGVTGATVDFDLNQNGGKGHLRIERGGVELPGLLEDPRVPVNELNADAQWQLDDRQSSVTVSNLRLVNADVMATGQGSWKTAPNQQGPGLLDLQLSLPRAEAARVWRYLPLSIDREVRDYVREAVLSGQASDGRIRVRGDLRHFPFANPKQGEFRISTRLRNVGYAYVPRSINRGPGQWAALAGVTGDLVFERQGMQLRGVQARFAGAAGLQVQADASIPDLAQTVVNVNGVVRGPLAESLGIFNASPVAAQVGRGLARMTASGTAEVRLKLGLPIAQIDRATVQGSVLLSGNDVQVMPEVPLLSRARGTVSFTDRGFSLSGVQARALGGDVRIEGGTRTLAPGSSEAPSLIRVQGTATAEGLRQAREIGVLARLGRQAQGSASYSATLGLRPAGVDVHASTTLQGLALSLPAPLSKTADASLPVRLDIVQQAGGRQEQVSFDLGRLVTATYVRDVTGPEARTLRGTLAVGLAPGESVRMPEQGVQAQINLSALNLDAWDQVLDGSAPAAASAATRAPVANAAPASQALASFLPTSLSLRARELTIGGQVLHGLSLNGTREGPLWRAQVEASELQGLLEYRAATGANPNGRLMARMARLSLPPSATRAVESAAEEPSSSMPALDVVVEDFELRGKKLGRLEIDAAHRPGASGSSEWRLNKLGLTAPEATFTATGQWTPVASVAPSRTRPAAERRRTVMDFQLDLRDSGQLLTRLGMPDVVRRGRGKLQGEVSWLGSPLAFDYPSMNGALRAQIESGQFLKADPGLAKLLGVLSLQALPRRLTLDFRDVFSEGFAFDFIRGDVTITQGIASTNNLQMKGVNAAVLMEGRADIARETQELKVVVVPEINAGTASLVASVINPAVGLGSFLAQLFLREPLMKAATQEFSIDGTWSDPRVTRVNRAPPPAPSGGN